MSNIYDKFFYILQPISFGLLILQIFRIQTCEIPKIVGVQSFPQTHRQGFIIVSQGVKS